ncbi:PREDICTED: WD repeat-containing protein 43-like [Brassica oleracea var. oleracea]|uniref:Small-subunit processome Utp12 domain-containing protein n=1 Tax=Brassica oleracea var. oleracea TaxID=109376 RepID=A0A0D3DPT3_BRAOL|nr:PREDICTED: WD repeat-containing protein 43-like [Brassica oleracea var. oleracea]
MAEEKLKPLPTSDGGEIAETPPREKKHKKKNKKRAEPDPDLPLTRDYGVDEDRDGVLVDDAHNEPTMGDKLSSLNLLGGEKVITEDSAPSDDKPPTAASVNVLLRQALHADDRSLLLDCLYNRDEQVIANSVAKLNSAEVLKLLNSLLPILQSRGAVLACAIPWIKSLLLTHSSGIMSQESSLLALNSMYQLIESRITTLHTAVQVSSELDLIVDDLDEEEEEDEGPVIYEDKDSDEEEGGAGAEEAMETDEEGDESDDEDADGVNSFEDFDDMSD